MTMDDPRVNVTEVPDGRIAVTTVTGELDVRSAPAVYRRALEALTRCPLVVVDLSGVTFCDSSGFNALLRLRRRAEEAGTRLALAAPPGQVARLLALTGADTVFPVYGSLAAARTGLLTAEDAGREPRSGASAPPVTD
ncbi:STAS domain-containing protein [Streptomyces sp. NPDC088847]|uniref:STAS domain-containing protein n=1 Tax=Streptomyces sp. NPDC088847 TaxID=3365909 RepID=UPI003824F0B7